MTIERIVLLIASFAAPPTALPDEPVMRAVAPALKASSPEFAIRISAQEPTDAAKSDQGATLAELEAMAVANNPAIAMASTAIQSARGQALQAGLYPNPVFTGGNTQWGGDETLWLASASQTVVVKRKLQLSRAAQNQAASQAEQALAQSRYQVLRDVRSEFYRALVLQERSKMLVELTDIGQKSLDAAERLRQGGEGTLTDELQLKVQLRRALLSKENTQSLLTASRQRLAALIGVPELKLTTLAGDLDQSLPNYQFELLRAGIISNHTDMQIADLEIQRRRILLRRANVEACPNLTFTGAYQYYADTPHHLPFAQVAFAIPVFDRNQGNIQSARAELSRSFSSRQNTENDLSARAADMLGRWHAAKHSAEAYEAEILPAARQTVELAQKAYQGGQFGFLQLYAAQRDLVDANLAYLDAQEARWQAAIDIAHLLQVDTFPPLADDAETDVPSPEALIPVETTPSVRTLEAPSLPSTPVRITSVESPAPKAKIESVRARAAVR